MVRVAMRGLTAGAAALLIVFLIVSCGEKADQGAAQAGSGSQAQKNTANVDPNSSVRQFTAAHIDGGTRNSSEWIGKQPVVLNFWGTWCPPCRREIPDLVKLYAEYNPKGVEILGLAVNDTPNKVKEFSNVHDMDWVMLMADRDIAYKYGATRGVPTTIFLDKDGNEVKRFLGPPTYEQFKQAFEAII